jgi:hypothetical protein
MKAAFAVGVRKARQQQLEATIENPLNMPLEAIPEDVNSLNGFNEVGCVRLLLTLATTPSSTPLHVFPPSFCTTRRPQFLSSLSSLHPHTVQAATEGAVAGAGRHVSGRDRAARLGLVSCASCRGGLWGSRGALISGPSLGQSATRCSLQCRQRSQRSARRLTYA